MASSVARTGSTSEWGGRETVFTFAVTGQSGSQLAQILEENGGGKDPLLGLNLAFETIDSAYEKLTLPLIDRVFALGNSTCEKIHKVLLNFRKTLFRTHLTQDSGSRNYEGFVVSAREETSFQICQRKIEELKGVCSVFLSEDGEEGRRVRKFVLDVLASASGYYKKQNLAVQYRKIEEIQREVIESAYDELSSELLQRSFRLNRVGSENIYRALNSFRKNAVDIKGIFDSCAAFLAAYGNTRWENERVVRKCVLGMLERARAFFEEQNRWVQLLPFEQIENEIIHFAFRQFLPVVLHDAYQNENRFICETTRQFWKELSDVYFKKGGDFSEDAIELSGSNFPVVYRICRKFIEQYDEVVIPLPERKLGDLKEVEFQKRFQMAIIAQNGMIRRFIENILNIAVAYYKGLEQDVVLSQLEKAKMAADRIGGIEKRILERLNSDDEGEVSYEEIVESFEEEILNILKPKEEVALNLSAVLNAYEMTQKEAPETNEGLEQSESEPTVLPPRSVLSIALEDSDRLKTIHSTFEQFSDPELYEPSCGTKKLVCKIITHFRKDLSSRYLHASTKLKNSQISAELCKKTIPKLYDICLDCQDQFNEIVIPRRDLEVINGRKEKAEFEKRVRMAHLCRKAIVWRWALGIFDQASEFYGNRWYQVIGEIMGVVAGEKDVAVLRSDAHRIDITQERERRRYFS